MGSDGGAMFVDPQTNFETYFVPQGIGADLIATLGGFRREDVDRFALRSQERATYARAAGHFDRSVVPVRDMNGLTILEKDAYIRADTTLEGLATLKPAFAMMGEMGYDFVAQQRYPAVERIEHVHTAGNSSGIVDGAALVLVGSRAKGAALGLRPRARVRAAALVGTDPTIMLTGPAPATKKALAKAGMTISDIDLVEVNEAFAGVVLRFLDDMGIESMENINVNGGAHRTGPSARRYRRGAAGHAAGRNGAQRLRHRIGHPLRGRRNGHCDDCRAGVEFRQGRCKTIRFRHGRGGLVHTHQANASAGYDTDFNRCLTHKIC